MPVRQNRSVCSDPKRNLHTCERYMKNKNKQKKNNNSKTTNKTKQNQPINQPTNK